MSSFAQHSSADVALDVELMFPGDRFPVFVGPNLRASGWRGGLFVQYVTGTREFTVEASDGNAAAGFILFQSEDYRLTRPNGTGPGSPENFISHQFRSPVGGNNVATMINGGTRAYFRVYETVAINIATGLRDGGAGNLTYSLNDALRVSENGLLCNDSDAALAAAGIAVPIQVGIVSSVPAEDNDQRLCIDLKF